jgi:2-oxoacid:acceptor oxidoreductase, alpha subunit
MDYCILIGGAAGQGMETLASILEKFLQRNGFELFTIRDYMSRVRGGHNFIQVRFGDERLTSHKDSLDAIVALNDETIILHKNRLSPRGRVLCDEDSGVKDADLVLLPVKNAAKAAGDVRAFGSALLGALVKMFSLEPDLMQDVIREFFNDDIAVQNIDAFYKGYGHIDKSIFDKPKTSIKEKLLINGNEAIALGTMAAGCRFYSAYPMTPSTSIMNYLASKMEKAEIVVEQAEDEIAAINMAIGASFAGVRSMTGTSGGGFSLMVEALGLSAMLEIPLVVAEIQRPGPTTGFPTRTEQGDLKFVISASHGEFPRMVIALRTPEDAFYQSVRAFNLADEFQIPVIIMGDQYLADYTTTIAPFDFDKVQIERYITNSSVIGDKEYRRYEITENGVSPRIIPGKVSGKTILVDSDEHDEEGHITESAEVRVRMHDKRLRKLEYLAEKLEEPEYIGADEADILFIAWGSLYGPMREAVEILNSRNDGKYGALVFGDIWPLPVKRLKAKAKCARIIINVEQNATGQLASLIQEIACIKSDYSILKYDGRPMSSSEIVERAKKVVTENA